MDRILHDVDNAHKILQLTSDTLILVDKNGTCLDIDPHSDLWFLQEDRLLGKNLFNLLPDHTFQKLLPDFRRVTQQGITVNRNYRLPLEGGETYYFKCIMQPYDGDKVLCQYRDITARSNVKLQLERTNYELKEIQKAAQIGQWKYSSREKTFYYRGYNGIVCTEEERSINFQDYYETILSEDLPAVNTWMEARNTSNTASCWKDRYIICASNATCGMKKKMATSSWKGIYRTSPTYSGNETTSTR